MALHREMAIVRAFEYVYEDHGCIMLNVSCRLADGGEQSFAPVFAPKQPRERAFFGWVLTELLDFGLSPRSAEGQRLYVLRDEPRGFIRGFADLEIDGKRSWTIAESRERFDAAFGAER